MSLSEPCKVYPTTAAANGAAAVATEVTAAAATGDART